jgi:hypothetical protein
MMNVLEHVHEGQLTVWCTPNASENAIGEWNDARDALEVKIEEPAADNKANKELVKFIAETTGKKTWLKQGYNSRKKLLVIED